MADQWQSHQASTGGGCAGGQIEQLKLVLAHRYDYDTLYISIDIYIYIYIYTYTYIYIYVYISILCATIHVPSNAHLFPCVPQQMYRKLTKFRFVNHREKNFRVA